jgi:hypothetical protein
MTVNENAGAAKMSDTRTHADTMSFRISIFLLSSDYKAFNYTA